VGYARRDRVVEPVGAGKTELLRLDALGDRLAKIGDDNRYMGAIKKRHLSFIGAA